jgi:ABC-2 type transport system permease protein
MKEITALFIVNAKEFLRDRMSVILVLLMPVAFASFFGLIFGGGDGSWALDLAVVNEDTGIAGERFVQSLYRPEIADAIQVSTGSRTDMADALEAGDVDVVLILPADMTGALGVGEPATLEVLYDASRAESAGTGLSLVETMISEANLELSGATRLLTLETRGVNSQALRAIDTQMPGMLGVAMLWLGLFGTAIPIMQQRTAQILRRLSVTPLRPGTLLAAHIGWRVVIGLVQAGIFLLVGSLAFGIGVQGNPLVFAGAVVLGALVFVSLGYVLAGLSSSQESLMAVTQLVNLPMMLLSGGLFAIDMLPGFLKPVANALPLTYLTDAFTQLMAGAPPLHPLWLDFTVLGGCLVLFLALGVKLWRWE